MKRYIYEGEKINNISFPLGGIGTGSVGLAGNGRFVDWEIKGRPDKGSINGRSHIAVKAETEDGKLIDARILNGDCNVSYTGQYGLNYGHGIPGGTMAGFPHFRKCTFDGRFPVAELDFEDYHFPGKPHLTALSPFIPLNDKDSSIPAAFFDISITNTSDKTINYTAAFSLCNMNDYSVNSYCEKNGIRSIFLGQDELPDNSIDQFDMTVATDDLVGSYQEYWYRGGWNDATEMFWRNFTEMNDFVNRSYDTSDKKDHCTLASKKNVLPGETANFRFIMTWSKPNDYNYWKPYRKTDENGNEVDVTWKNYYATLFKNSKASADYCFKNYDRLVNDTVRFRDELFESTLPDEVIDAASATTSVLRTATCLRLENGEFYGWEGVNQNTGSCEGTCTHVWNYAYAMCFLFPKLERSIRDTDYKYNIDKDGRMQFRIQLPLGREQLNWRACVDGQMGGIIKSYREWKISGNDEWLRNNWEQIKASLEYAWNPNNFDGWDADCDGVLEGRQHHTLDMELFGPSSWLEGFYLAALKCASEMAEYMGDTDSANKYTDLFNRGKEWSDKNLFNGKWYMQKIDLTDYEMLKKYTEQRPATTYWNDETGEIKYQIGEGSEIDQLLAQWHANIIGIGDIFDKEQRLTALKSLYKYNFKKDMREFYNPFRLYSANDEAGAVICEYPEGVYKPTIPIPYCQETMHGFEYALAGLMISEGMIDEGLEIVRSVRDRYDGAKRNPWNEIECGSNYARSMASFALIPIFSGFKFDMTKKLIGFDPIINKSKFRSVWSLDSGWGNVCITDESAKISLISGSLSVKTIALPEGIVRHANCVTVDGKEIKFTKNNYAIMLDADDITAYQEIIIK